MKLKTNPFEQYILSEIARLEESSGAHGRFPERYAFDASKPRYGYADSTNTADLKKAEAENRFNVRSEQWISWWRTASWEDRLREQVLRDKWIARLDWNDTQLRETRKRLQREGYDYLFAVKSKKNPNGLTIAFGRIGATLTYDVAKPFDETRDKWVLIRGNGGVVTNDENLKQLLTRFGMRIGSVTTSALKP